MCCFSDPSWKYKTSEKWFWLKLDRNYVLGGLRGWYYDLQISDSYWRSYYRYPYCGYNPYAHENIKDYWYTQPISEEEFDDRAATSGWIASRSATAERKWHPYWGYKLTPYQALLNLYYSCWDRVLSLFRG